MTAPVTDTHRIMVTKFITALPKPVQMPVDGWVAIQEALSVLVATVEAEALARGRREAFGEAAAWHDHMKQRAVDQQEKQRKAGGWPSTRLDRQAELHGACALLIREGAIDSMAAGAQEGGK